MLSERPLALALYWVCAATALWLVGSAIDRREQQTYLGEPDRQLILSSFHEAASSVEGVPACSLKNFHRGGQVGVNQTFSLHAPLRVSMTKIEALMLSHGWKIVKRGTYGGHPNYLKLCRDGLSASFSADQTYAEKCFDVRVIWAKEPNQSGYCPR